MTTEDAPERLPRGRHGLSREEVANTQRERLIRALGEAMLEKGYVRTSVADVLKRARVSRETFYELFSSKEDCFMQAFEDANTRMLAAVFQTGGSERELTPLERIDRFVHQYLDALADEPALARIFLIEVYAAGPDAARRRTELQQRFVTAIAAVFGVEDPAERFSIEATIHAVSSLVTARLAVGDIEGLRALHGPLMAFLAEQPFVQRVR